MDSTTLAYSNIVVGSPDTLGYRVYFKKNGVPCSPLHDIPLWSDKEKGLIHMVVEIPRDTKAKLEISKDDFLNPIKQDLKNGKLRYVAMKFPYNYGAAPQTWENPNVKNQDTGTYGDNDPIDICEIGDEPRKTGEIIIVKVLGIYALIDQGETDWKIMAIDVTDKHANYINDLADLERVYPGKLKIIYEFLRDYKIPDGKPPNDFGFGGKPQSKEMALAVIEENNLEWKKLITGAVSNQSDNYFMATECTQLPNLVNTISAEVAEKHLIDEFTNYIRAKH
eukprot:TRINITY_DN343_c0_g1_i3.p1 TRINITY_DN343_c0_g1~~TRINITY_DN343_c0_g1_i3.p1  ORF type:complete len:280 (-),score=51.84 TRINITY_DN343_c0_g1_i3:156-995(-)